MTLHRRTTLQTTADATTLDHLMPELVDLIVRNGTLVTGSDRRAADIAVADGRFVAIDSPGRLRLLARDELDADGLFVLPGLIDSHVHFRQPGLEYKEDWQTGSRAAVMGGITTVLDMPNTLPPTSSVEQAGSKIALAGEGAYCDFGLFGLVRSDNLRDVGALAQSGLVVGFKVFLGDTTGSLAPPSSDDLARAMSTLARVELRLGAHAEDRQIVDRETARIRQAGRTDALAHLESRPPRAEVEAIRLLGGLARTAGCGVHVFHLSSAAGMRAVEAERKRGVDMTCEVSAHHCFLSADDYPRLGGLIKTNPPVRTADDGAALLNALGLGRIDVIASDHAPHTIGEKRDPDIWLASPGVAGVETTLRLFLTHAVSTGRLSLEGLVRAFAEAPARTWGIWPRKAALRIQSDADMTIVDLGHRGVIRAADLNSKHRWSPFDGWPTLGAPVATIVRGHVVMRDGTLLGAPGWGRLVERAH